MNTSVSSAPSSGHPAPRRPVMHPLLLWFGLVAAPLAWMGNQMIAYFVASHSCKMQSSEMAASLTTATSPWFIGSVVLTLLVAGAGMLVALRNWRAVREEGRSPGRHLLDEPGEGRTRFVARCSVLTSTGFLIAYLFTLAYMVVAPLCDR